MPNVIILSLYNPHIANTTIYTSNNITEKIECDILVCLSNFNPKNLKIKAKTAILYGDVKFNIYKNIKCNKIITYGMSGKNTVTISSVLEDKLLIAIQRELYNYKNQKIDISELFINKSTNSDIDMLALTILSIILA